MKQELVLPSRQVFQMPWQMKQELVIIMSDASNVVVNETGIGRVIMSDASNVVVNETGIGCVIMSDASNVVVNETGIGCQHVRCIKCCGQ